MNSPREVIGHQGTFETARVAGYGGVRCEHAGIEGGNRDLRGIIEIEHHVGAARAHEAGVQDR
jgi:hypothetical protein